MSRLSRILEEVTRIKGLYKGKLDPVMFFDVSPLFDDELESYCAAGSSVLVLKIAKRLAARSPHNALKAILSAQKKQTCGHCGKPFYAGVNSCECYERQSDPSDPWSMHLTPIRKV